MPGSPNTSFIPKNTPSQAERKNSPRQLFIGTLIVRILFFAVLIASIAVFAYERRLTSQLAIETTAFNTAVGSFESEETKLEAVISMDKRLSQAKDRFQNNVSVIKLLRALELSTIETVQIKSLELAREDDSTILLSTEVETDTFDSVIFQRTVLEGSEVFGAAKIADVTIKNLGPIQGGGSDGSSELAGISFNAEIAIAPKTITPDLTATQTFTSPTPVRAPDVSIPTGATTTEATPNSNQDSL